MIYGSCSLSLRLGSAVAPEQPGCAMGPGPPQPCQHTLLLSRLGLFRKQLFNILLSYIPNLIFNYSSFALTAEMICLSVDFPVTPFTVKFTSETLVNTFGVFEPPGLLLPLPHWPHQPEVNVVLVICSKPVVFKRMGTFPFLLPNFELFPSQLLPTVSHGLCLCCEAALCCLPVQVLYHRGFSCSHWISSWISPFWCQLLNTDLLGCMPSLYVIVTNLNQLDKLNLWGMHVALYIMNYFWLSL